MQNEVEQSRGIRALGALALALVAGCAEAAAPAAPAARPVEVGIIKVNPEAVTLHQELPGRTSAHRIAQVRARVDGIVLARRFEEGAEVEAGQPLFSIDPKPYQAALASAEASLARAEAAVASRRLLAQRYTELLADKAVSQQEYDDAIASERSAQADVAAAKAAVDAARINLGYTRVTAPISGRIGRSEVTEGAFVQQSQATLLATIQQLDPIYVDVTQSSAQMLELKRRLERGELQRSGEGATVKLALEDGSEYPHEGTLQFSDVTVSPTTGSITLRAVFPNPERTLLPGMFVRAHLEEGTRPDALLVPQLAVQRDAQGNASVLVVAEDGQVQTRAVKAARAVGDRWLVTEGLSAGDAVVVEGLQKVRPGAVVTTTPVEHGAQAALTPAR
ncbi:MAG: efflux RND transporter periplasmic adaptor subunit [Deltaproteobacteria bacterium]|nr:efflux RND transporter periplasmic adaptor subunit [Deltaproteobacteria bacterium]